MVQGYRLTNSSKQNDLVDRENEIRNLKMLIAHHDACAYLLYSQSGVGKSSVVTKLIRDLNTDKDILPIRVKTAPKNYTDGEDGTFLYSVFKAIVKTAETLPHTKEYKKLRFEYYVSHIKDKALKRKFLENFLEQFYTKDDWRSSMPKLVFLSIVKRFFHLGEFNYINILRENSLENMMVISNYIKTVIRTHRILLCVDNMQNIDNASLKHFLDWMNETKDFAPFFLFEYTLSDAYTTETMQELIEFIRETGISTRYELIPYLKSDDAISAICYATGQAVSESFTREAREFYVNHANGNMRRLIDFQLTYTQEHKVYQEGYNPTLENLRSLDKAGKQVVAILNLLNGKCDISFLERILVPQYMADITCLNQCIHRLINAHGIISIDDRIVEIRHASILDIWEQRCSDEFQLHHLIACRELANILRNNFELQLVGYYSMGEMLLLLLKIYAYYDLSQIYGLIMELSNQIIDAIDPSDLLDFMKLLISATGRNLHGNNVVYERMLQICYEYEMFEDGLKLLQKIDTSTCDRFQFYEYLFMTELNYSFEVIRVVKKQLTNCSIASRTWLILSLILIINYRKLNEKTECQKIADLVIAHNEALSAYPEYGYFLRLQALYLPRANGLKEVAKSVVFFEQSNNYIQASKSRISLSFYLAITGQVSQAYTEILKAEACLKQAHVSRHMFENNKAAICLLHGFHNDDVWNALDRAELSAIKAFDMLAITNNKLIWCLENKAFDRCDLLVNRIYRLFSVVSDKHMHAFIHYNLYLLYASMHNQENAQRHYAEAERLKLYCHTLRCRLDHILPNDNTDYLLTKPWHVCFLSYWCFDLIA